jgi:hypothetical protein
MSVARDFLRGIIDYAGLFPPASLDMAHAVAGFGTYSQGSDHDLLGRFVVPTARLAEFSEALQASRITTRHSRPWRLSVIPSAATPEEAEAIREFNQLRREALSTVSTKIDAVEMQVRTVEDVRTAIMHFGKFELFLEPVGAEDPSDLLHAIAAANAAAKLRTGGTTPGTTPAPEAVMRFIQKCSELGMRFKATAGLHHALRNVYPLTYAPDSPRGPMYGYLNIFLAAAFTPSGIHESALLELLQESEAASITFDDSGVSWRGHTIAAAQLRTTREHFAVSFGSCSFTEPVEEARELHLI